MVSGARDGGGACWGGLGGPDPEGPGWGWPLGPTGPEGPEAAGGPTGAMDRSIRGLLFSGCWDASRAAKQKNQISQTESWTNGGSNKKQAFLDISIKLKAKKIQAKKNSSKFSEKLKQIIQKRNNSPTKTIFFSKSP